MRPTICNLMQIVGSRTHVLPHLDTRPIALSSARPSPTRAKLIPWRVTGCGPYWPTWPEMERTFLPPSNRPFGHLYFVMAEGVDEDTMENVANRYEDAANRDATFFKTGGK
eukprot:Gb_12195 [translate_table: standard]